MPSRRDRTPYPPAAQLFFRLVVMVSDSTLAMKLALVACDLLTMIVLWRWLVATRRSEWLTIAYAWNPLVVFEIAHSGHIDALAALWIAASAFWLARRRTQLASVAFVLACATKLLPIVLAPLYIGRVRVRDVVIGALCLVALYLPFMSGSDVPLGAVPNVVDRVRFNGPLFAAFAALPPRARRGGCRYSPACPLRPGTMAARGDRSGGLGVANGHRRRVRAGHLSLVSAVGHTFPLHRHDAAPLGVDHQRAFGLRSVGPVAPWRTMDHPNIGHVFRIRCSRRRAAIVFWTGRQSRETRPRLSKAVKNRNSRPQHEIRWRAPLLLTIYKTEPYPLVDRLQKSPRSRKAAHASPHAHGDHPALFDCRVNRATSGRHGRPPEAEDALDGLDPVLLVDGKEVPGKSAISVTRGGFIYLFSTPKPRQHSSATQRATRSSSAASAHGWAKQRAATRQTSSSTKAKSTSSAATTATRNSRPSRLSTCAPTPEPIPFSATAAAEGQKLIDRAVAAIGGAANARCAGELHRVDDAGAEPASRRSDCDHEDHVELSGPRAAGTDDDAPGQDDDVGNGAAPQGMWFVAGQGQVYPMRAASRSSLEQDFGRNPVALLTAATRGLHSRLCRQGDG